jgi:hypothetical protein
MWRAVNNHFVNNEIHVSPRACGRSGDVPLAQRRALADLALAA